jgi:hypothetical protein
MDSAVSEFLGMMYTSICDEDHPSCRRSRLIPSQTKIMVELRYVELSSAKSPKSPTWRVSCQCLMTGNPSRGTQDGVRWASAYAELDSEHRDNN